MPSNISFLDTNFPTFTDEDSTEKKINTIQDYLYMTVESLRYALSHLNEGNMEQSFVDSIIRGDGSIAEIIQKVGEHEASITALVEVTGELGENMAEISETVDEQGGSISLIVQNVGSNGTVTAASIVAAVNSAGSSIKINADKIDITGSVKFLQPSDVGASGSTIIDGARITTGTITFNRLDSSAQTTINNASTNATNAINTANDASSTASSAASTATSAYNKASGIETNWGYVYQGTTYIDGTMLMTGTVTATMLKGGSVSLLDSNGNTSGIFSITGATSGSFAIDIKSNSALRLRSYSGDLFLGSRPSSSYASETAWVNVCDDGYVKISPCIVCENYGTGDPTSSTPGYGINGALYFKYS